jgi:RNA ligase
MLDIINRYYDKGLLTKQTHPELPLTIWNYTERVQYDGLWDNITLMCRGLVTDSTGNIVARPFRKFFNMEEGRCETTSSFEVYDKLDGSLGILFKYKGQWIICTRGSFVSDQAVEATKMLDKYDIGILPDRYTYLFEIIYPENRIVVDYNGHRGLVLLGAVITESGIEPSYGSLKDIAAMSNIPLVRIYNGIADYKELKDMVRDDEEGFIVKFDNGERMKVKGAEYIRLHKLMTNISTTVIWEHVKDGFEVLLLLEDVPDEFYKKIQLYVKELNWQYGSIRNRVGKIFDYHMYGKYGDKEPITNKKEYAEWVMTQEAVFRPILFNMFDRKDYSKHIWKLIKPKYEKL